MTRTLAFLAASACAAIAVTSACFAGPAAFDPQPSFTLDARPGSDRVQLQLRSAGERGSVSSSFATAELVGFNRNLLGQPGANPIQFALVRDPGRLGCAGKVTGSSGQGTCRFAPTPAFANLLASHGVARPTLPESYALAMVGANSALVEAIGRARYSGLTIDTLTALSALKVDAAYIDDLARRGYRPAKLDDLVAFKALGIDPAYIDGMTRSGYARLDADAIVQFKALGITPAFVAEMSALGYRNLPADDLVQLKIFKVGAADIRAAQGANGALPSVETLVERKIFGGVGPGRR